MKSFEIQLSNEQVTLTTYLLDASSEMPNTSLRPAVLILPGGAYRACSDREAEPIAMAFLSEGYQAFVLRYSINQHAAFPRPLQDAEEALECIRTNCVEWGINPDQVAVCGFSAGGHLAAALGTMGRVKPNALILGYPCILASMSSVFPTPMPGVDEHVDATTPPTFIFHTYGDALVPVGNALAFASALEQSKVSFELHIFKNGVHGLSLAKHMTSGGLRSMVDDDAAKWFGLCIAWLSHVLGRFSADQMSILLNEDIEFYSIDAQLGVLWKNADCKQLIQAIIPELQDSPQLEEAMSIPLRKIIEFGVVKINGEALSELNHKLKGIPII